MSIRYYNYYGDGYNSCVGYSRCCYYPNYAPVANNDCISVYEDKPLTISPSILLDNDTDKNGDRLTIISVQNAAHGTVSLVSGNVVFTPAVNYNGPASFSYTVSDGNGGTSTATVSVNICPVNDAPDAVNDNIAATSSAPLTIDFSTLLANDKDVEADTLSIRSVQNAINGSVALADGSVIFTPAAGFSGTATFSYTITDGKGGIDTATVSVYVPAHVVDAVSDGVIELSHNTPIKILASTLLANDSDSQGHALTVISVQGALNGTVSLLNGIITFVPNIGYSGPATFTYTVSDGSTAYAPAINISLNFDSVAQGLNVDLVDGWTTNNSNGKVEVLSGSVYGTNSSSNVIELERHAGDAGNLIREFNAAQGQLVTLSFDYAARAGHVAGSDSAIAVIVNGVVVKTINTQSTDFSNQTVQFQAQGGLVRLEFKALSSDSLGGLLDNILINAPAIASNQGLTDTAIVTLNVLAPVNVAPDAMNDRISGNEDTPIVIAAATLLANDTDANGDKLTITSVQGATHGAVVINASGEVVFTPTVNYNGPASFTYSISDGKGGVDTATVNLTICPVNDVPDAVNDSITGDEDTPVVIAPATLLGNDTDADGNTLTISSVQGAVNGTVALVGGNVVFTPAANYNGPASFTYSISDGKGGVDTATVNLTICPVNDAPVVGSSEVTVSEEGLINGIVDTIGDPADLTDVTVVTGSIAFSDADSASLTISLIAPTQQYSSHGTLITWSGVGSNTLVGNAGIETIATISIDSNGQYSFKLTGTLDHPNMTTEDVLNVQFGVNVSDGTTSSQGTITVAVEDDAPSVISQTVDLIENDNVNIMIVLDTSGSMKTTDGVDGQTRLQTANEAIVKLLDKYETDSNVMVRLVTFASNASALGTEWVTVAAAKVLLNNLIAVGGTNYDEALGDAMTAFADAGKLGNAQNVSYFFSDGAPTYGSGTIDELTPQGASPGTPAFNGTGYDQTGLDAGIQINEAHTWTNFLTQNQIKSYSLGIGSGISNQAYLDPIAYNGQTQTDMNGLLVSNFNQLDDVLVNTIKEVNGQLASGAYGFGSDGGYVESITVGTEVYTFAPGTGAVTQAGGASSYSYNATTYMLIVTTLAGGKFTIDMDSGVYSYTPSNRASNQLNDVISFKFVDGDGDYASSTITFVALQTNAAPNAIADDAIVGHEDTPVVIAQATLLANDTDADGNTLTISSVQNALNGTVTLVSGDVVFTPVANYHGPASFTYTITDGNGGTSTAMVSLEVAATPTLAVVPSVSEEGLVGGIVDSNGVIDISNSNILSGFVSLSNPNGTGTLSLVAPTDINTSGGDVVTWQGNGTQTLSAYAGSVQVATLTINNLGAYTFELSNSFDHPVLNVEDVISLNFDVVTTDGVSITNNPLIINIEDDMPSATAQEDNVAMIDTNLLITLDISGSMLQASGIDSQNRLQSAVQSISSLLDTYKTFGDVRVRLVTFSSEAQAVGDVWFTVQEAKDALNLVALSGVTNYDAAIGTTIAAYDSLGKLDNAQVLSYFFSDGDPNRGNGGESQLFGSVTASAADRGIQSAEEETWKAFLTENQIKAFAIGMGSEILSPEKLDAIAYDGQAQKDISGVVVTQFSDLTQVLADTVEASNTKGALDLGADNGFLKCVTMEGVSYTYSQQSNDISATGGADASQFDALAGLLTVTMSSGGKFDIDVNNGTYQYFLPPNITTPIVERFDYLASDFDGDTAGATVNVTVTKTNVLTGTSANDTLLGNTGPDLIIGREGNDVINGNRGDDRLFAGEGDDTLIGGQGDDKLSGGTGADTFIWTLDDISGLGMEVDTVVDFDTSTNFEALNLSDLLQGESGSADSLENYLHFNFQSGNTFISVSSGGLFADNNNVGSMSGIATDQQIILLGVDLIGASVTDAQVLQNLLTQQKIISD